MSQEDTHLDAENTNNPTGCSLQPTGTHDPSLIPPISLLPVELLVKIIHATHTSASSVRKDHPVCDLPSEGRTPVVASLLMSHVCQRWRYAALASPELWANIAVRANTSMTFLDFIWAHIGDVPVSIDIKLPWNSGEEVHALIGAMVNKVLANPDRLRSLTAVISEQNFGQLFRSFPNTLGNLEHLDLAICQYGGPRPGIMDPSAPAPVDFTKLVMNIRTPNLSSIELSDEIAVQWSSPLMQSPHLTHFVGSYGKGTDNLDGGDLYRMLARCQHLRELSVRVKYFSRTDSEPTIFSHTPMDLSNIVVLELFAYDWFLVRDLLHSIRIPMRNLKRLRVSLPNHQPPMPTEQFWNALRIASSNNVRLTPETLCVDGFRITSMVWTSTKASDGQLSNGKQPTFRFIVDSSTPSRLFKEPDEYQAIWGFETLRSLEIQGTQIPESVWCVPNISVNYIMDIYSRHRETLTCDDCRKAFDDHLESVVDSWARIKYTI